jgi:hypothetical protein
VILHRAANRIAIEPTEIPLVESVDIERRLIVATPSSRPHALEIRGGRRSADDAL